MKEPAFSVGIEEEYQIIDPVTRDLTAGFSRLALEEDAVLADVKPELHQCQVEIGSRPCATVAELRGELVSLRGAVIKAARKQGLAIASAGTHPFSNWMNQEMTPKERYLGVKAELQDLAHRLLIFGTHVHVGIDDNEFRIDCLNAARYILPHLLCLSTSSPFWFGRNTGLHSYRSIVFKNFPRTGVPRTFTSWADYQALIDTLMHTKSIPDGSKIWWDVRPHYTYPTLEFRVCDVNTRVDEAICIVAIVQAVAKKLWKLRRDNMTFRVYAADLIEENKWRAVRYGMGGKLIDFGKRQELPAPELIRELIAWFLDDVLDELGTRKEVEYAYTIMAQGTSAQRQLACYQRTGDMRAVVDQLIRETAEGVTEPMLGPSLELTPAVAATVAGR
ncbi:MAG: carboxylate-amine ligase [Gemmatimonadaceae bacterium]|jgi:carboxylate-amine ligase|nr:carboxylate-amine ligase [Gemmatimonadaceae bacterium]